MFNINIPKLNSKKIQTKIFLIIGTFSIVYLVLFGMNTSKSFYKLFFNIPIEGIGILPSTYLNI